MTRIVLIRHGQALAYTEQIVAGHGGGFGATDSWYSDDRTRAGAPGSESIDMMVDRVGDALQRLAREHPSETIVVACHGGVIGCSFEALAGVRLNSLVRYTENTA